MLDRKGTFYTNTHFYVLFRLLEILYSRLHLYKELTAKAASDPAACHKNNSLANQLGLLADFTNLGDHATNAVYFYGLMLESCEKLFDNELEQTVFEDSVRYMFGVNEAYRLFTIDKVVGAIVKQVQTLLSDAKSQELFDLLRRERDIANPTTQDLINSRKNTERVLGPDENLFRMDWLPDAKIVTIQLLGKDDSSFDDSEVLTGRWQAYVESYVSPGDTEGISTSSIRRPFLKRTTIPAADGGVPDALAGGSLSMRVCVRTYKLFYVAHTEDFLWRVTSPEESEQAKRNLRANNERRVAWLEKFTSRDKSAAPSPKVQSPSTAAA
ncbi:hypothetical protein EW026_g3371 [Hermanssonia centrifuga]|uniref:Sin3 C-terminal domain-containing protein n=1 Tax=Hermanssonia centrifuga TaxID=98765 RepID=A0A4S4KKX3_9APHY|nr:hypothetical protein EW026_g3371 [Hermanssonia centrifuga]